MMTELSSHERIMREGLRLIASKGYRDTTVGAIEKAAGLTARAGGFYRHFKSKEDLLVKLLEQMAQENLAKFNPKEITALGSIRAELISLGRLLLRAAEANRTLRILYQREGHNLPALRRAVRKANTELAALDVLPWVESAIARTKRRKADKREIALMIFGPVLAFFLAQDRGEFIFGMKDAESFIAAWADHWSAWFEGADR